MTSATPGNSGDMGTQTWPWMVNWTPTCPIALSWTITMWTSLYGELIWALRGPSMGP